jgi:hypothetical protein
VAHQLWFLFWAGSWQALKGVQAGVLFTILCILTLSCLPGHMASLAVLKTGRHQPCRRPVARCGAPLQAITAQSKNRRCNHDKRQNTATRSLASQGRGRRCDRLVSMQHQTALPGHTCGKHLLAMYLRLHSKVFGVARSVALAPGRCPACAGVRTSHLPHTAQAQGRRAKRGVGTHWTQGASPPWLSSRWWPKIGRLCGMVTQSAAVRMCGASLWASAPPLCRCVLACAQRVASVVVRTENLAAPKDNWVANVQLSRPGRRRDWGMQGGQR